MTLEEQETDAMRTAYDVLGDILCYAVLPNEGKKKVKEAYAKLDAALNRYIR